MMRRTVVAIAALGASGLIAGCAGEAGAEVGPATGPTADVSVALLDYEPSLDGYSYEPANEGGVAVMSGASLPEASQVPVKPEECLDFQLAHNMSVLDDGYAFENDVRVDFGWLAQDASDEWLGMGIEARQYATADIPAQVAQATLDTVEGCETFTQLDELSGDPVALLEDVAATAVELDGLDGKVVRVDATLAKALVPGEDGELTYADSGWETSRYLYPYGRVLIKVEPAPEVPEADVAAAIAHLVAYLDAA